MSDAKGVEAVERALKIIDCFSDGDSELSLADLARQTGQYKSTILRLIVSLEKFGYLMRTDAGRYRLGPTLWRLGVRYRENFDIGDLLRPELRHLSMATNETASYFIREGDSRICLFRSEPLRAIRHSLTVGAPMPLTRGASGKVLLAYSGDDSQASEAIRAEGHAFSLGERDPEVGAVAVPILNASGQLMGVIAVSGLITRFGPDRREELLAQLLQCQQRLSERLGAMAAV